MKLVAGECGHKWETHGVFTRGTLEHQCDRVGEHQYHVCGACGEDTVPDKEGDDDDQ